MTDHQIQHLYLNKIIKHINKANDELRLYNKSFVNQYGGSTSQIQQRPELKLTIHNDKVIDKIIEFSKEKKQLQTQFDTCTRDVNNLTQLNINLTEQIDELNKQIDELNKKIDALTNQLTRSPPLGPTTPIVINNNHNELDKLRQELRAANKELKNTKTELKTKEEKLQNTHEELKTKTTELDRITKQLQNIIQDNNKLQDLNTQLQEKNTQLVEENIRINEALNKKNNDDTSSNQQLTIQLTQLYNDSIKSLTNKTTDMINMYEKLYNDIYTKIKIIISENEKLILAQTNINNYTHVNIISFIKISIPPFTQNETITVIEGKLNDIIESARNQYNTIVEQYNTEISKQQNILESFK
jgi:chromosome segregation ATPase